MAEPTQFTFNLPEVAELLIKKQGIHEGKWLVGLEFNVNIGMMGVAPPNAYPGAMILCNGLQLTKGPDQAPANLVVDAALVNPAKETYHRCVERATSRLLQHYQRLNETANVVALCNLGQLAAGKPNGLRGAAARAWHWSKAFCSCNRSYRWPDGCVFLLLA